MTGIEILFWALCFFAIFYVILRGVGAKTVEAMLCAMTLVIIMSTLYLILDVRRSREKQWDEKIVRIEKTIDTINSDIRSKSQYIYVDESILYDSTDDTQNVVKNIVENGYVPTYQMGQYKVYRFEKNKK